MTVTATLAVASCGTYVWEHSAKTQADYDADFARCKVDVARGMPPMYMAGIYARDKIADCMRSHGWQIRKLPG